MTFSDDLKDYRSRWAAVNEFITKERQNASSDLRWMQLNAAYGMAKELGLLKEDPSELGVYERWAKIKARLAGSLTKP